MYTTLNSGIIGSEIHCRTLGVVRYDILDTQPYMTFHVTNMKIPIASHDNVLVATTYVSVLIYFIQTYRMPKCVVCFIHVRTGIFYCLGAWPYITCLTRYSKLIFVKKYLSILKFHWQIFLRDRLTINQHWFEYWFHIQQATCHYLATSKIIVADAKAPSVSRWSATMILTMQLGFNYLYLLKIEQWNKMQTYIYIP